MSSPASAFAAPAAHAPPRIKVVLAYAAVYLIWGSTYLGIAYAIRTIPPLAMASARYLIAGALIGGWALWRGAAPPTRREWGTALVAGFLLQCIGNGGVVLAEQVVASGRVALVVSTMPLSMAVLDWLRPGGTRPSRVVWIGLLLGLAGVALLIGPEALAGTARPGATALQVLLLFSSFCWAAGSLYMRHAPHPEDLSMNSGAQMLAGGLFLGLAALLRGEFATLDLAAISPASWAGFWYLVVFGSVIGYSCFVWLMKVSEPNKVATYAFVNPAVAVVLGALMLGEEVGVRTLVAAAVIVAGVALITLRRR